MAVLCHILVIQDIPQAVYEWAKILLPSAILFISSILQYYIHNIVVFWDCWNRIGMDYWSCHLLSIGVKSVDDIRRKHVVIIIHHVKEIIRICNIIQDKASILEGLDVVPILLVAVLPFEIIPLFIGGGGFHLEVSRSLLELGHEMAINGVVTRHPARVTFALERF